MPDEYGGLVALCQMVPGPASSQVRLFDRAAPRRLERDIAAWAGFTLPSAAVMFGFALLAPHLEGPTTNAVLRGLKLVAVAVVAQAVWNVARTPAPIGGAPRWRCSRQRSRWWPAALLSKSRRC